MTINRGKPTPGQDYPDRYRPGSGDSVLDEIWEHLDHIKPGVIPVEMRAYIAGMWRGHVERVNCWAYEQGYRDGKASKGAH